jgi:hypothetical protein
MKAYIFKILQKLLFNGFLSNKVHLSKTQLKLYRYILVYFLTYLYIPCRLYLLHYNQLAEDNWFLHLENQIYF